MTPDDLPGRYRRARSLFWVLAAFGALVHLQLFLLYQYNPVSGLPTPLLFFLQLPWLMAEHLWLAAFLGLIVWLLGRDARVVVLSATFLGVVGIYLLINQVYFSLFRGHLSLSASEGQIHGITSLWDSFTSELGWVNLLNALLLICALSWVIKRSAAREDNSAPWFEHPNLALVLVVWLLLGFVNSDNKPGYQKLDYLSSLWRAAAVEAPHPTARVSMERLYETPYGNYAETQSDRDRQAANFQALRSGRLDQPNILLIVLESVGSLQLMPNSRFDPVYTPFLASQQERMQVFDNLYTPFPSTARSHIPLLTAGNNISWGSVYDEFRYKYSGTTLVGHYADLGYSTGFFSSGDLNYENRMAFYQHLPLDDLFGYKSLSQREVADHGLNSWGMEEGYAWSKALDWVDGISTPFFLHYMTVSGHHPYTYPDSLQPPGDGETNHQRYRNTLYYADSLIRDMLGDLASRDLLDNTIVAITGDHGQAFGLRHRGNYTHKNRLYEENLRTFLLLIDPRSDSTLQPHLSDRPGSIGDIAPTLMALQEKESPFYPSQNLLGADYTARLNYFHKSAHPPQWGVRDVNWKYIGLISGGEAELYNLATDPEESNNLADQYPDRVRRYDGLTAQWFLDSNHRYRAELADYQGLGDRELDVQDFRTQGPKAMDFVIRRGGENYPKALFDRQDSISAWTRWVPYNEDKIIDYYWVSPREEHIYAREFTLQKGWSSTWVPIPAPRPLQPGVWTLRLKLEGKLLITGQFTVGSSQDQL